MQINPTQPSRPNGELIWMHATSTERLFALCDVTRRLKTMRPDLRVLCTWESAMEPTPCPMDCDIPLGPLTAETKLEMRQFLDHWKPDVCLWSGGDLRRALIRKLYDCGIMTLWVDMGEQDLPDRRARWLPDQRHRMLGGFSAILTPNQAVADRLYKMGVAASRISISGPLRLSATPPDCADSDLDALHEDLGSRPVWLAARLELGEIETLITAHRHALRLLHRLLLIIVMNTPQDVPQAKKLIQSSGLNIADWELGEEPEEHNQILLCGPEDLGLWYRIAPLTFIGGSLENGAAGHDPLDPAALGSAILHGPGIESFREMYARLQTANAARLIVAAPDLAEAVIELSAPDQAAEMALAGWEIVTEGAQVADELMDRLQTLLDDRDIRGDIHACP